MNSWIMKYLVMGIAVLIMSACNVDALNAYSRAYCRVYPDPHFTTWHGDYYDYHGGCDLVLITNSLLDFHIRTANFTGWAGITAVAIKIGTNKLEIYEPAGSIFVNSVDVTAAPPATFSGYTFTVVAGPSGTFRIDLAGGQYILLTRTYLNTLQVDVLGHGSNFGDSEGLCANWTADSPNALRGRDGTTIYPLSTPIPYGEHWQVSSSLGDPIIFGTPAASTCLYTSGECTNPQTGDTRCQERQRKAEDACKGVTTERNARANCEFDVRVTNDPGFANTTAYTNPIIGNPEERCVEVIANLTANVTTLAATGPEGNCTKAGGRCVWRCDGSKFKCVDQYCRGPDQGCSCAIPIVPVPTPVGNPAPSPVTNTAPTPTATAPVTNTAPSPVVKPVPTPVTNTAPTPVVKPVPTPVTNTAPTPVVKPVPTPVKPPTRRLCFFFGLICFDTCGLIGRLLGLC